MQMPKEEPDAGSDSASARGVLYDCDRLDSPAKAKSASPPHMRRRGDGGSIFDELMQQVNALKLGKTLTEAPAALRYLSDAIEDASGTAAEQLGARARASGALHALVNLLEVDDHSVVESTLFVLANLSSDVVDSYACRTKNILVEAGAFEKVVPYLWSESETMLYFAAGAVQNMCCSRTCAELLRHTGAETRLLDLADSDSLPESVVGLVQGCLDNLQKTFKEGTVADSSCEHDDEAPTGVVIVPPTEAAMAMAATAAMTGGAVSGEAEVGEPQWLTTASILLENAPTPKAAQQKPSLTTRHGDLRLPRDAHHGRHESEGVRPASAASHAMRSSASATAIGSSVPVGAVAKCNFSVSAASQPAPLMRTRWWRLLFVAAPIAVAISALTGTGAALSPHRPRAAAHVMVADGATGVVGSMRGDGLGKHMSTASAPSSYTDDRYGVHWASGGDDASDVEACKLRMKLLAARLDESQAEVTRLLAELEWQQSNQG